MKKILTVLITILIICITSFGYVFAESQLQDSVIWEEQLRNIVGTQNTLSKEHENYTFTISGDKIVNPSNSVDTNIRFAKEKSNAKFVINNKENLPGTIVLKFKEQLNYNYLCIYNDRLGKYQRLEYKSGLEVIELNEGATYLLTIEKISDKKIQPEIFIYIGIGIFVFVCLYITFNRRYWFW